MHQDVDSRAFGELTLEYCGLVAQRQHVVDLLDGDYTRVVVMPDAMGQLQEGWELLQPNGSNFS